VKIRLGDFRRVIRQVLEEGLMGGPALDMIKSNADRDKAVQAIDAYESLYFPFLHQIRRVTDDPELRDKLLQLSPQKALNLVVQRVLGKDLDLSSSDLSPDAVVHEIEHLIMDPTFVLNPASGTSSSKSKIDSFMDELVISRLWGDGATESRGIEPLALGLYVLLTSLKDESQISGMSLSDLFSLLSGLKISNPELSRIFNRQIRSVRMKYASDIDQPVGDFYEDHPVLLDIAQALHTKLDLVRPIVDRLVEEKFKQVYLAIRSKFSNFTKQLQTLQSLHGDLSGLDPR
jgi:hypothetical protein